MKKTLVIIGAAVVMSGCTSVRNGTASRGGTGDATETVYGHDTAAIIVQREPTDFGLNADRVNPPPGDTPGGRLLTVPAHLSRP